MQCNQIPINIPTQFFTDTERVILNFIWESEKHRIEKILNYEKTYGGITIPDHHLNYRAIVINVTWYCYKDRQVDQYNRTEDP